jgi:acetylserotonin N-methyltransferase
MQPRLILDLINGHRKSMALFAAVQLNVFDSIPHSDGSSVEAIAISVKKSLASSSCSTVSREGISRLLHSLASLGLLCITEGSDGPLFFLSEEARLYLNSSSSTSLNGYIRHCRSTCYPLLQNLDHSVISGSNAWEPTFGCSSASEIFGNLYQGDSGLQRFLAGMHSFAALCSEPILRAFEPRLRDFRHIVDLGGASGAILDAWSRLISPQAECTVVDLEPVCRAAQEKFDHGRRVQWLALDFFDDQSWTRDRGEGLNPLPGPRIPSDTDCFVMTRILHDWEEEKCLTLLSKVYAHLPSGGGLLIGEMLIPSSGSLLEREREAEVRCQDLNMLVQTRGRERSIEEYSRLLGVSGFDQSKVQAVTTGSYLDAIFVTKD